MYPCKVKAQCAVQGCYILHFISKRSRFCSTWNRSRTTVWQDCRTPLELTRLPVLLDSYGFRRSCTLLFVYLSWHPPVCCFPGRNFQPKEGAVVCPVGRYSPPGPICLFLYIMRGTMSGHRFHETIHALLRKVGSVLRTFRSLQQRISPAKSKT